MSVVTPSKLWHTQLVVARLAFKEGDYSAALRNLTSSLEFVEQNGVRLTEDQQKEFLYMESLISEASANYSAAEEALAAALHLSPKRSGSNEHAIYTRRLAGVYRLSGEYGLAEKLYKEALEELQSSGDNVQIGKALMGLGEVLHATGDNSARTCLNKALETIELGAGRYSILYGRCLLSLASVMTYAERELAREYVERAITIVSCKAGPNHPLVSSALKNMLEIVDRAGEEKYAAEIAEKIRKIQLYLKTHDI